MLAIVYFLFIFLLSCIVIMFGNTLCLNVRLCMQQLPPEILWFCDACDFLSIQNEQAGLSLFKIFPYCISHPPHYYPVLVYYTLIQLSTIFDICHQYVLSFFNWSQCRRVHLNASKDSSALWWHPKILEICKTLKPQTKAKPFFLVQSQRRSFDLQ